MLEQAQKALKLAGWATREPRSRNASKAIKIKGHKGWVHAYIDHHPMTPGPKKFSAVVDLVVYDKTRPKHDFNISMRVSSPPMKTEQEMVPWITRTTAHLLESIKDPMARLFT